MSKSVALAGFASSTRDYVRSLNVDEVWSLNMIHSSHDMRKTYPININRLFDIHPLWMIRASWYSTTGDHWKWLTTVKHHYPIYLIEECPEVHNSVVYPLEDISNKFLGNLLRGDQKIKYFTSSFCYMLAMAIYEGFDDIYISGFEMGSDTEYVYQKSCAEFWIGIASQHATVHIPEKSLLVKSRLYGFDSDGQIITKDVLEEYRAWYLQRYDEVSINGFSGLSDEWIEAQMIVGAVSFIDTAEKDQAITRHILEHYKEDWDRKRRKFQAEINVLNAQGWEKKQHNENQEELMRKAFERMKYLYRYDGAYQLACKLIAECDLQTPSKKLVNRHAFQRFSEVEPELN